MGCCVASTCSIDSSTCTWWYAGSGYAGRPWFLRVQACRVVLCSVARGCGDLHASCWQAGCTAVWQLHMLVHPLTAWGWTHKFFLFLFLRIIWGRVVEGVQGSVNLCMQLTSAPATAWVCRHRRLLLARMRGAFVMYGTLHEAS
jgi:hypothetical protein